MADNQKVSINDILESQIPEYLNEESPIFKDFLKTYYTSLEHKSGAIDLAKNLQDYKKIENFTYSNLVPYSVLTDEVLVFDTEITVASTVGWPETYGLLKIDNEIITYKEKNDTTFFGCVRGFSGIDSIKSLDNSEFLEFSTTTSEEHSLGTFVYNLSNLFIQEFFTKFKSEFLPGFEARNFVNGISIQNVLSKAKDFYIAKGTDSSYKILFKLLYGKDIELIKPQDYTIIPSANNYFITKNILVEKISGPDPVNLKGNFLYQNLSGIGTVSASIFNVEYRPIYDKNFYELSLDSTSFSGTFQVTGKTKILEDVSVGSDNILVDSTIGFSKSGTILIKPEDSDYIELTYTDTTINQFLGVSGITKPLTYGLDIVEDKFAYGYVGLGNTSLVEFRIVNVIQDVDFSSTSNLRVGDRIGLSGFGKDLSDNFRFNTWIYNIPTNHNIKNINQEDSTKYRINLYDRVTFYKGEKIILKDRFGNESEANIISVEFETGDTIRKYSSRILVQVISPESSILDSVTLKKIIIKTKHNSDYFANLQSIPTGVQNTYIDFSGEYLYVSSTGAPTYEIFGQDTKVEVNAVSGEIFSAIDHGFSTGDSIFLHLTSSSSLETIKDGYFFVTKVDENNVKLSYSKNDVYSKKYISLLPGVTAATIVRNGYEFKTLKNQKIFKKFNLNSTETLFDDKNKRATNNREIGLLINGVELLSPTLFDENIYYGPIESIKVTDSGINYDVVNPPTIQIDDLTGFSAKAHVNLVGDIKGIKVVTPGIGYQEKPKINISGGNGTGCVLESNLVKSRISVGFRPQNDLDLANDTITFSQNHNLDDAEEIIYFSNGNVDITGIVDQSHYYVGVTSETQIKLYNTFSDAVSKSNPINLTGISSGFHNIQTLKSKNTITEVYVKESGSGYSNRAVKVPSRATVGGFSGINTFDSYVYAPSHGFHDGELVIYSTTNSVISGLSTESEYYVKVLDSDRFKLSVVGTGLTANLDNFNKKKYVKFNSIGVGTHTISYPPIQITVESLSAIGSTDIVSPVLKPLVFGSISDVYLEDGGVSYGSTNVVNFHRRPEVGFGSISSVCVLKPIILNGVINDIKIINKGRGYRVDSDIIVYGSGKYAELEPIVENGRVISVNIIKGGVGYASSDTTLVVQNRGSNAKFLADVTEWKIDQAVKSSSYINADDQGLIYPSKDPNFGLQYIHFYVPNKIRYQLEDNFTETNKEVVSGSVHSPILGYAYDGNPIYGPYGYDPLVGGTVRQIRTSYELVPNLEPGVRPPGFNPGYFIDDYVYTGSGDLDEYNGRYCITPQYPNGTYAYFTSITIDSTRKSKPVYPYIVGQYFKGSPITENFDPAFTQNIDFDKLQITRNVGPYYLTKNNSFYDLIDKVSSNFKQEIRVNKINSSGIGSVSIFSPGNDYQVDDRVVVSSLNDEGAGANIVVSQISGKEVSGFSVIDDQITSINFNVAASNVTVKNNDPHNLLNNEKIYVSSISDQQFSNIEGFVTINVFNKSVELLNDIDTEVVTGVSTFISVKDVSGFSSNDLIGIGTEVLRITTVSDTKSGFYVNRLSNTGIHTAGDIVELIPTKFTYSLPKPSDFYTTPNSVFYFDPKETVGVGTLGVTRSLVGIGTSTIESRFIPEKSIYIPNHPYYTGQPLQYNVGFGGTSMYITNTSVGSSIALSDGQTVYAVKLGRDYIGLSTIGFTSTTGIGTQLNSVYFLDFNSYETIGFAHSLTTLNPILTGSIQRYSGIVTTKDDHGLVSGDVVHLNISDVKIDSVKIVYNPQIRKLVTDPISFSNSDVSLDDNTIYLPGSNLKTGDKVVYISSSVIGGLQNNGTYFVSKNDFDKITLCNYESDINDKIKIEFSSTGASTQYLHLINPAITAIKGSILEFDLSDESILDMNLEFYLDNQFRKKIELSGNLDEGFSINRTGTPGFSGAKVTVNTDSPYTPNPLYYNLIPKSPSDVRKTEISVDTDIVGSNKITIKNNAFANEQTISVSGPKTFFINVGEVPKDLELLEYDSANISYITNSKTAYGPISKTRINFSGKGYTKPPYVSNIESDLGKDAVLKLISPTIGRVEEFDRIKDGFDYPTDPTLSPSLSIPSVISVKDIRTIDYVGIVTGGRGYNQAPTLIVKEHPYIKLEASVFGGSINEVQVIQNVKDLRSPLNIISTYNSNGYDIDFVTVAGSTVTLELSVSDTNPLITSGYGSTVTVFPFAPGDEIFIENCRLTESTKSNANFNSSSYDYQFFTVTSVDENNYTVSYSMSGISTGSFGTYDDERTLGFVVNKKDLPVFEMVLSDDAEYFSKERVTSNSFSATVMEGGWDNDLNQMRVSDSFGILNVGDKLTGENSKIKGTVETFSTFDLNSTLGVTRDKIGQIDNSVGILNDFQQRISDNFYYQKFSYSIKSEIPYDVWKESVRSIIHPSGFKEFSDLEIVTKATENEVNVGIAVSTNLKPRVLSNASTFLVNIDNEVDITDKSGFAVVYEEDSLDDGSVERVFINEGPALRNFIVNKTNKVLKIDDISDQFDGTSLQSLDGRYADASDLLELNKSFIQEEVVGFITATYPGITTNPDWNRTTCYRDVGYIVDAISHDVKYKSNNRSVEAGLAYWEGAVNAVDGEVEETIAGFNYIIQLSKFIINNVGVNTSYQLGASVGISSASYNNLTGETSIVTTSPHGLSTGDRVVLKDLVFSCDSGGGINTAIFPSLGNGPDGNGPLSPKGFAYQVEVINSTSFVVNPGVSTITHSYVSGGTVQEGFVTTQQYFDNRIIVDSDCSPSYSENCCADVWFAIGSYVGIITTIIGIGTTSVPTITFPSTSRGGMVVGLSTFKLKNKGYPLFKREFVSSSSTTVSLSENTFILPNHNFQTGQELIYSYGSGSPIGIATTSYTTGNRDILMNVGSFDGTAVFENGYGTYLTTSITGLSTVLVPAGPTNQLFNDVIGVTTTGGFGATFDVLVTYASVTGQPLSTSISLVSGGYGYSVGDVVSIAGTYLGGSTPADDLSFVVSTTAPTGIQTEANNAYLSVPSEDSSGALFNVSRDNDGRISIIDVVNGGSGYAVTSIVSIAGTYIGGLTPQDTVTFVPTELGTNILPETLFVYKLNDSNFRVSGLSTSIFLDITSLGTGTHSLEFKDPNPSTIITIDGVIQTQLRNKSLSIGLGSSVSTATTTIVQVSSGINSVSSGDIINIGSEYLRVSNVATGSTDLLQVERGSLGTLPGIHTVGSSATVLSGDYNVIGDTIYFTTPPYGKIGPTGLQTGSIFGGRVFSRKFDGTDVDDRNVILDDISLAFTGIAATEFTVRVNGQTTKALYNDTNNASEINNNPIILINNVAQESSKDYTVDGSSENVLRFLSGTPSAGRIVTLDIDPGFGYVVPLVATAEAVVSASGTISSVNLIGIGSGYRLPPTVSLASTIGFGASITASVGSSGTITGFTVVNPGSGYTSTSLPTVVIGIPTGYSNLGVGYTSGTSGVGDGAKLSVVVGQGSSVISFKVDNPGVGYKIGDVLNIPDLLVKDSGFRTDIIDIVNFVYDNTSGVNTVTTLTEHNLQLNDNVRLSGAAFTCGYDEVGIQTFSYDNVTGICTVVTYSPHGLLRTDVDANKTSSEVFLFNLPFSCAAEHAGVTTTIFPDGTSSYGKVFPVLSSVGLNTFTMNAGISTIPHIFEGWPEIGITTFAYYQVTGLSTVTTSSDHQFEVGDKVTLSGLAFTCNSAYAGLTTTIFPDGTSEYGYTFTVTSVNSSTEFEFLAGISTIVHYYNGGGYAKKVPTVQRVLRFPDASTDGAYEFRVIGIGSTNEFTFLSAGSTITHYYTQSGIVSFRGFESATFTVKEVQTDKFAGFYPGQFIKFDDISPSFNGFRKKFTLSVTISGVKEILSLRTEQGSDLDITNNIFVYINNILQIPGDSYTYFGSRISFRESPKADSKCSIFYYRGSSLDVEEIQPPKTIKEGDLITIVENRNDLLDTTQFERVVKKIVASDQFDTFTYSSVGIDTDPTKFRPLRWRKQKQDRVINGSLYSKARPSLSSIIRPSAKLIKKLETSDTEIYVDNAFPIFTEVDALTENLRDIIVTETRETSPALSTSVVSSASTVSSLILNDSGVGYAYTNNPTVTISQSAITRKDPIKNWTYSTGLTSAYDLSSVDYGNVFVSVGSSSIYAFSETGSDWYYGDVGYAGTIGFNAISCGGTNIFMAVGEYAVATKSIGYGLTIGSWNQLSLVEEVIVPGLGVINRVGSSYTGDLFGAHYSPYFDTWTVVGAAGSIFGGVGIGTTVLTSRFSGTLQRINDVTSDNTKIVAVANNGTILGSVNNQVWESLSSPVAQNLNKIISVDGRFIVVGNGGVILRSNGPSSFESIGNNVVEDIIDIYFKDFYVILTSAGNLYYSFDLSNWIYRETLQYNTLNNIIFEDNIGLEGRYLAVGSAGTAIYSDPILNRATAEASVTNGIVTSINIINGGFGYTEENPPSVLIEPDPSKTEKIVSFKVVGDFGTIIGINTFIAGTPGFGTVTPKIDFILQSETYDNSTLGVGYSALNNYGVTYSQLSKGDYFVITDSNVQVGHALTGITTSLGGMTNYPTSVVGTAVSFLDGVYRVENVTSPSLGIVTVTCNFAPAPNSTPPYYVNVYARGESDTGIGTNNFYGRYSWSKIYDFQNRILSDPKSFEVYNNGGLTGISTNPQIFRTRGL